MITPQDIFNAAWNHFVLNDNPPAVDEDGDCCYLTADGRKCAVGLCIPDGHPAQRSGNHYGQLILSFPDLLDDGDVFSDNGSPYETARRFQRNLHDGLTANGQWAPNADTQEKRRAIYTDIAAQLNLTIPTGD